MYAEGPDPNQAGSQAWSSSNNSGSQEWTAADSNEQQPQSPEQQPEQLQSPGFECFVFSRHSVIVADPPAAEVFHFFAN